MRKRMYGCLFCIGWAITSCVTSPQNEGKLYVEDNDTITLLFTLCNGKGVRFDDSYQPSGVLPLRVVHGRGDIIPGFERGLAGLGIGDTIECFISPEEGYGQPGVYYRSLAGDTVYIIGRNDTIRATAVIVGIAKGSGLQVLP